MAWYNYSLALLIISIPLSANARYLDQPKENYKESTSVVQRLYDSTMKASSTMAGAPNATTRGTDAPRLKIAPNAIDRTSKEILDFSDDIGGARQAFKTEKNGLPRRPLKLISEKQSKKIEPVIITEKKPAKLVPVKKEIKLKSKMIHTLNKGKSPIPTHNNFNAQKTNHTLNKDKNVIPTHSNFNAQRAKSTYSKKANQPVIHENNSNDFLYRKIDQSKTLTTPSIGQHSMPRH